MIELKTLLGFYQPQIANNAAFRKHILKEYVELLSLEYLSRSPYVPHLAFIGGTNLRLVYGIDRFSEDLDFDCKDFSESQFMEMTDSLIDYLKTRKLVSTGSRRGSSSPCLSLSSALMSGLIRLWRRS